MERWILSLGIDCARAAITAALSRAFASGSGSPILAATVISRLNLEKRAERFLSCAPFRYMMFLNLLCPAMIAPYLAADGRAIGFQDCILFLPCVRFHFPQAHNHPHDLGIVAVRLGLRIDVPNIVGDALLFFLEPLNSLDEQT